MIDAIGDAQLLLERPETMLVGPGSDDNEASVRDRGEDVGQCADGVLVTLVPLEPSDGDD